MRPLPVLLSLLLAFVLTGCDVKADAAMPDVIGGTAAEAEVDLADAGYEGEVRVQYLRAPDEGITDREILEVCDQSPLPGETLTDVPVLTVAENCNPPETPTPPKPAQATPAVSAQSGADEPQSDPEEHFPSRDNPDEEPVTFDYAIDGDTVETSAGRVRIIGIDTPERGKCGFDEATYAIEDILDFDDEVLLVAPRGQNDEDRYGRLLRYVLTTDGVDIGLMQLEQGNAVARYDSRDGYPTHPKEDEYHAAEIADRNGNGSPIAVGCSEEVIPTIPDKTDDAWWMEYSSCTKLKQNAVGHPKGPFNVGDPAEEEIYNWFAYGTGNRGDGDGDGLACE